MNWEELLQKLIDLVETAAPELWEIALRQVYAGVVRDALIGVLLLIVAVFFFKLAGEAAEKHSDSWKSMDWYEEGSMISLAVSVVCALFGLILLFSQITPIINPKFYAIKILISLVK